MASMKKYSITDYKRQRDFYYGFKNRMEHQNFLVFILRRATGDLVGYNARVYSCFTQEFKKENIAETFVQHQIHPDHHQELQEVLQDLAQTDPSAELLLDVKLKSGNNWKPYQLQIRNYHWNFTSDEETDTNDVPMAGEKTAAYSSISVNSASPSPNGEKNNDLVLCIAQE